MNKSQPEDLDEDICEKHKVWIIQYSGNRFSKPIFFIWYTDDSGQDNFLLNAEGNVIALSSLDVLLNLLSTSFPNPQILSFLKEVPKNLQSTVFSSIEISKGFARGNLSPEILRHFVDVFNLCGDLSEQFPDPELKIALESGPLREAWEFYYNRYFWKQESGLDDLSIQVKEALLKDFNALSFAFENRIELIF